MPRISSLFADAERVGGSPVELYTFQRGQSVWRHTSSDTSQTFSGLTYTPAGIKRASIEQKQDTPGIQVDVTLPLALSVIQALMVATGEPMYCSIQRVQPSTTPIKQTLLGKVISTKYADDVATCTIATAEYDFKKQIPAKLVARTCQWAVYEPGCGANAADFAHDTTIDSIAGQTITLTSLADSTDDVYTNGMLRLDSGRILFIVKQTGLDCIVWAELPPDCIAGASVTAYQGCDKQFSTCETKFANAENFGGFPNLPTVNPSTVTLT